MGSETDRGEGEASGPLPYSGPQKHRQQRLGQSYTLTELAGDQTGTKNYRFNTQGFRGDEYDPTAAFTVFVFGESHAFGNGLDLDETWCWRFVEGLVEREGVDIEDVCILNFADGGLSNSAIARSVIAQCSAVRPDLVLVNFANYRRTETFLDGVPLQVQPTYVDPGVGKRLSATSTRAHDLIERSRHYYSFATTMRQVSETLQAILLVQNFLRGLDLRTVACCNALGEISADWVWSSAHVGPLRRAVDGTFLAPVWMGMIQEEGDLAADGAHLGPSTHRRFAGLMLQFFEGHKLDTGLAAPEDPGAEITSAVQAFYAELPFNYHESVEQAAKSVRSNLIVATYPDLHDLLRSKKVRRVAELGCGAGSLASSMALHYGLEVVAVDLTQKAIDRAQSLAVELGVEDQVEFVCADLFEVSLDRPVDLMISMGVLHHTRDAERAFHHGRQFVRPGGHVYVGLYHEPGRTVFLQVAKRVFREQGEEAAYQVYRSLEGVRNLDEQHARSWFRDQVLHPHETLHTLRQTHGWMEEAGLELVSTSINGFQPFELVDELFDLEPGYADRAHKALIEERRYFPGFFTFLAKDRSATGPSAAR